MSTAAPATRLSKARERVKRIGIESKEKRKIKKEQGANGGERERERGRELLCVYFIGSYEYRNIAMKVRRECFVVVKKKINDNG